MENITDSDCNQAKNICKDKKFWVDIMICIS